MCSHSMFYEQGRADERFNAPALRNLVADSSCDECGLNNQSAYDLGRKDEQHAKELFKEILSEESKRND